MMGWQELYDDQGNGAGAKLLRQSQENPYEGMERPSQ